eukprot:364451-Chlamydomonas_euryale.AAC.12
MHVSQPLCPHACEPALVPRCTAHTQAQAVVAGAQSRETSGPARTEHTVCTQCAHRPADRCGFVWGALEDETGAGGRGQRTCGRVRLPVPRRGGAGGAMRVRVAT